MLFELLGAAVDGGYVLHDMVVQATLLVAAFVDCIADLGEDRQVLRRCAVRGLARCSHPSRSWLRNDHCSNKTGAMPPMRRDTSTMEASSVPLHWRRKMAETTAASA